MLAVAATIVSLAFPSLPCVPNLPTILLGVGWQNTECGIGIGPQGAGGGCS